MGGDDLARLDRRQPIRLGHGDAVPSASAISSPASVPHVAARDVGRGRASRRHPGRSTGRRRQRLVEPLPPPARSCSGCQRTARQKLAVGDLGGLDEAVRRPGEGVNPVGERRDPLMVV